MGGKLLITAAGDEIWWPPLWQKHSSKEAYFSTRSITRLWKCQLKTNWCYFTYCCRWGLCAMLASFFWMADSTSGLFISWPTTLEALAAEVSGDNIRRCVHRDKTIGSEKYVRKRWDRNRHGHCLSEIQLSKLDHWQLVAKSVIQTECVIHKKSKDRRAYCCKL